MQQTNDANEMENLKTAGQIAMKDKEIAYQKQVISDQKSTIALLRQRVVDELSPHAKYTSVGKVLSKYVEDKATREEFRGAVHEMAKSRVELLVKEFEGTQDEIADAFSAAESKYRNDLSTTRSKYASKEKILKAKVKAFIKKSNTIRKNDVGGKGGNKGACDPAKKRRVKTPRCRFIADITPIWKAEKQAAEANGVKDFVALFNWVTPRWIALSDAERKVYNDAFEKEKLEVREGVLAEYKSLDAEKSSCNSLAEPQVETNKEKKQKPKNKQAFVEIKDKNTSIGNTNEDSDEDSDEVFTNERTKERVPGGGVLKSSLVTVSHISDGSNKDEDEDKDEKADEKADEEAGEEAGEEADEEADEVETDGNENSDNDPMNSDSD